MNKLIDLEKYDNHYFEKKFRGIYSKLIEFEADKFTPPRFSRCFKDIADVLGLVKSNPVSELDFSMDIDDASSIRSKSHTPNSLKGSPPPSNY